MNAKNDRGYGGPGMNTEKRRGREYSFTSWDYEFT